MTARDLFTEEPNPPSGLGIPQPTVTKVPGAVGSIQPKAEALEGSAEAPTEIVQCWACDHGRPQRNGFVNCELGPAWKAYSPSAPCQMRPAQFIPLTAERAASRIASSNTPEKGRGSAAQSASRNGGGGAETSAAGPDIADTSRAAYAKHRASGKLTKQQGIVLAAMEQGRDYTRQELVKLTGLPINVIAGRARELVEAGRIEVARKRGCTALVTGLEVEALRMRVAVAA